MTATRPRLNGYASAEGPSVRICKPKPEDGSSIWELVKRSDSLETNSCYAYVLLASHFADTCLVAHLEGRTVGFVLAFRPPSDQSTVFVWQIGVDSSLRRHGLGRALLHALIRCPGCEGVEYLAATVGSSNAASKGLFERFARDVDAPCDVAGGFSANLFLPLQHESEDLLRIGPLRLDNTKDLERTHVPV